MCDLCAQSLTAGDLTKALAMSSMAGELASVSAVSCVCDWACPPPGLVNGPGEVGAELGRRLVRSLPGTTLAQVVAIAERQGWPRKLQVHALHKACEDEEGLVSRLQAALGSP